MYAVRPHAPDGAPTVGVDRIGRGAVLERRAATCGLQNPLRPEWFNSVFGCFGVFLAPGEAVGGGFRAPGCKIRFPTPMRADLAGGNNFGYQNRF